MRLHLLSADYMHMTTYNNTYTCAWHACRNEPTSCRTCEPSRSFWTSKKTCVKSTCMPACAMSTRQSSCTIQRNAAHAPAHSESRTCCRRYLLGPRSMRHSHVCTASPAYSYLACWLAAYSCRVSCRVSCGAVQLSPITITISLSGFELLHLYGSSVFGILSEACL